MTTIERISVPVSTRAPTGQTNAYLVRNGSSLVVDPADRTDELTTALDDETPDHLLVTHTHSDHVGGVSAYADGPTVWAHADYRDRFTERTGVTPDRTFADGTVLPGGVEVVATPGHAPDHVALAVPLDGDEELIVGDLAVAEGSVVVGGPDGDMAAYLDSLRRLRTRQADRLYPGHGPVIENPEATLTRLLDHRTERERSVLSAVEAGATTVEELTDAAYEKDLSGVRDLAEATVVAHLEKLADEGAIEWDGERARPR